MPAWLLATAALLGSAGGCDRHVAVGHEGELNAGGETSDALWSADHELGTFDEWLGDGSGLQTLQRSGMLEITSERARSGARSFIASITANDGAEHHAVLGRELALAEGRYGAWYFLPEELQTDYWVIMKLSNGAQVDRFDIDIEVPQGGEPRLRLYEHDDGYIAQPSPLALPLRRWVHVEVRYRSTPAADGRVIVLQDGEPVIDTGPRPTANDDQVAFYCGSVSRYVAPAPYRLFIDDASIHRDVVP